MDVFFCVGIAYILLLLTGVITIVIVGTRMWFQPIKWDRHVSWLKGRPWTWQIAWRIGLILMILQLAALGLWRLAMAAGWLAGDEPDSFWALIQVLIFHAASFLILAVVIKRRSFSWRGAFGFQRHDLIKRVGQGLACYLAVLPVIFCASLIYHLVLVLIGYPMTVQDVALFFLEPRSFWSVIFLLVLAVVVAPVAEEALFRGVLLPLLMKRLGTGPAIFLTSILFAMIHFHIPSIMPLFVLALAFSIAYIYTESIVVPIVMHALFNGMNLGLLLIVAS